MNPLHRRTGRAVSRHPLKVDIMNARFRTSFAKARNYIVAAPALLGAHLAMAQATDPFDTAVTTVTGKINDYGPALVALSAVGVVFVLAIKYVKKIPSAS